MIALHPNLLAVIIDKKYCFAKIQDITRLFNLFTISEFEVKMAKTTKNIFLVLVLIVLGIALTGCNTFEGFGKDVEGTGQAIQDIAN